MTDNIMGINDLRVQDVLSKMTHGSLKQSVRILTALTLILEYMEELESVEVLEALMLDSLRLSDALHSTPSKANEKACDRFYEELESYLPEGSMKDLYNLKVGVPSNYTG